MSSAIDHASRLINVLSGARVPDGTTLAGWRFEVAESETIRLGIRESRLGGPYEGAGVALLLAASLELHWSDGLLTRTTLDRRAVLDPAARLSEWRETAISPRERRLPPLAGPIDLPVVQVYDQRIAQSVTTDSSGLLRLTAELHEAAIQAGALRTDAIVRAVLSRRTVATSCGFRADWPDTLLGVTIWVDELGSASYERRLLIAPEHAADLAHQSVSLAAQLRQITTLPVGARGVLFAPTAVDQLVCRFLLPNLAGRAIRDGRSCFALTDLQARRQVAQAGLSLSIDTTLPFEPASAPCSPEGVPAGRSDLIIDGRLAAPMVDQESAAGLGYAPTPRPRGRPYAILAATGAPLEWDGALVTLGNGVIVRELPGLHTQAARRADYALVTPDAQAVIEGRVDGRCAVRLAGNAINHVSQPSSRLVRAPGASGMGLLVVDGVTLLPA